MVVNDRNAHRTTIGKRKEEEKKVEPLQAFFNNLHKNKKNLSLLILSASLSGPFYDVNVRHLDHQK